MHSLLLASLCITYVAAVISPLNDAHNIDFHEFVTKFNKQYSFTEHGRREKIFIENMKKISRHNIQEDSSFRVGVNEFADMTLEEFTEYSSKRLLDINVQRGNDVVSPITAAPTALDWRTNTNPIVVPPVRSSSACSPPVNAVIDSVAGDYAIQFKENVHEFDPSYVTKCDGSDCSGTTDANTWAFITKHGLQWNDTHCPTTRGAGICISGVGYTKKGDETDLLNAVASKGPISVAVDASHSSFQLYASGIYYEPKCSNTTLDFKLLLVGYGSSNGQDYWIARNSWGTSWGQNGDIFLARNKNNNCGIATLASYAKTIAKC